MRFLCICQWAHSRSVAMSRVLQHAGHEAASAGTVGAPSAIAALAPWADRILLAEPHMLASVPPEYRDKAVSLDIGPDRWVNPYNQELRGLVAARINATLGMQVT